MTRTPNGGIANAPPQFMSNQTPHHSKSMSEDSVKRMLKKNASGTSSLKSGGLNPSVSAPTSKPSTRPNSGQKKPLRPTQSNSSQGHYESQSQQQLMMMLLQQQQSKVKSISDSHRVLG